MTYEMERMLERIRETSWREMQDFAERVSLILDGCEGCNPSTVAEAIVRAAEELTKEHAEKVAAAKKGGAQ